MDGAGGRRLIVTAVSVIGLILVACATATGSPSAASRTVSAPVSPSAGPAAVQVALHPGNALLCTVYDESETESQYRMGVRAASAAS
jgi:hypothetical protein